jgi:predicted SAM-dependent methyltransferase
MAFYDGTFRSYFGAIGIPTLDSGDGSASHVTHEWANAVSALGGGLAITTMRIQQRNRRVDIAKNMIVESAIKNGCQFVLLIDDDVMPPPDGLMKMLRLWKSHPKYKIISGVYWSKSDPTMPLIFKGNLQSSFWDWTVQDIIPVDGAGAGFLFVDIEVFKKMSKPWFSCEYFFEDPRIEYDMKKTDYADLLKEELLKEGHGDPKKIKEYQDAMQDLGDQIRKAYKGEFDPNLLKNKPRDASTTEDLYFFKKAKEEMGLDLWMDCSIQCIHQDKRTGRMWGITADMPQAKPEWTGRLKPGGAIVLDLGSGDSQYWIPEGTRIRIDNDPTVKPDICCDVRFLPFADCFVDMIFASHILEHFSFKEVISVLKEWGRVLKIGGKIVIIVPNLKWAAKQILKTPGLHGESAMKATWMFYSGQHGTLQTAYTDYHMSGYTPESMKELIEKTGIFELVDQTTSEGVYGYYKDFIDKEGMGYNIITIAKKVKHETAISFKLPIAMQEEAKKFVGEVAKPLHIHTWADLSKPEFKGNKPAKKKFKEKVAEIGDKIKNTLTKKGEKHAS